MINESLLKSAVAGKDGFVWWIGRVAHRDVWKNKDKKKDIAGDLANRCKVRIIGYHPWDDTLPENELPWAHIMLDAASGSGQGGMGITPSLRGGETCMGFFLDGDEAQQPVVLGLIHRHAEVKNSYQPSDDVPKPGFKTFTGYPDSGAEGTKIDAKKTTPIKKDGSSKGGVVVPNDSKVSVASTTKAVLIPVYDEEKKYKVGDKVLREGKVRYFDGFGWDDKDPTGSPSDGKSKDSSSALNKAKVSTAHQGFEREATVNHTKPAPSGCEDGAVGGIKQALTDFITLVDGLESAGGKFIDPIRNKAINMKREIKQISRKVAGIMKGVVNNIRDGLISKLVNLFAKFSGALKELNPLDMLLGPGFLKGAKGIMKIIYCLFEKVMNEMVNFLANLLTGLVNNLINGPICALDQFVSGILAKAFNLIEDLMGPVMEGIEWLTGGIGNITSALGKVSSLASSLLNFIDCDKKKCKKASKWVSGALISIDNAANDWSKQLKGVDAFKGIQSQLADVEKYVGSEKLAKAIAGGDLASLKDVKVGGSGLVEVLKATDAITGGSSAKDYLNGLGSIESALSTMTLFGNGGGIFDACNNKLYNPEYQDDIIPMPIGFIYEKCIPPKAIVAGNGSGAEVDVVVGVDSRIFSVEVLNGGTDYDDETGIAIIDNTNHGTGAEVDPVIEDGSLVRVNIISDGYGYCGGRAGTGIGTVIYIEPSRPGIGYTSGDKVVVIDPYTGIGITFAPIIVTPGNGSIIDVQVPIDFNNEFDIRPIVRVDTTTGTGAEFIVVMSDVKQLSTDTIVRPLVGITSVIDCPTDDVRRKV